MHFNNTTFGCHGIPERCFRVNGKYMPFCARCLGAAIGHTMAAIGFFAKAMLPLYIVPPALATMLADWLLQNRYRLYHSNRARLVTGIMGGYAIGLCIWLLIQHACTYLFPK